MLCCCRCCQARATYCLLSDGNKLPAIQMLRHSRDVSARTRACIIQFALPKRRRRRGSLSSEFFLYILSSAANQRKKGKHPTKHTQDNQIKEHKQIGCCLSMSNVRMPPLEAALVSQAYGRWQMSCAYKMTRIHEIHRLRVPREICEWVW